jgi:biopolymer transport protein ExbB
MWPKLLSAGGPVAWLLLLAAAVAVAVFLERLLRFHSDQINSTEFIAGIRNVLKRENIVEAISICDATPGPVARMVKTAILSRERGRDGVREAIEEAGLIEVPRLEEKLGLIATIAQVAPLIGLFGTVLGFIDIVREMEVHQLAVSPAALNAGLWKALISTALGLAVAIPCYVGYNYLVARVNSIVLDMERASTEIINLVGEPPEGRRG